MQPQQPKDEQVSASKAVEENVHAVSEMIQDEYALLEEYVKEDSHQFAAWLRIQGNRVFHWLELDGDQMRQVSEELLSELAGSSYLQHWQLFESCKNSEPIVYHAGDLISPGRYCCQSCGQSFDHDSLKPLEACVLCQQNLFERIQAGKE